MIALVIVPEKATEAAVSPDVQIEASPALEVQEPQAVPQANDSPPLAAEPPIHPPVPSEADPTPATSPLPVPFYEIHTAPVAQNSKDAGQAVAPSSQFTDGQAQQWSIPKADLSPTPPTRVPPKLVPSQTPAGGGTAAAATEPSLPHSAPVAPQDHDPAVAHIDAAIPQGAAINRRSHSHHEQRTHVARPAAPQASDNALQAATADQAASAATDAALTASIRQAVQAAARCPPAARMMEQSGRAGVLFDYKDGSITNGPTVSQSSGAPILDNAALAAVRTAHYPPAPSGKSTQILHLLVWVEEACAG